MNYMQRIPDPPSVIVDLSGRMPGHFISRMSRMGMDVNSEKLDGDKYKVIARKMETSRADLIAAIKLAKYPVCEDETASK